MENLLHHLPLHVTAQWYIFGLAIGVPNEVLEQLKNCSPKGALDGVLNYWLRNHHGVPSWKEITDAQAKVEFFQLASKKS